MSKYLRYKIIESAKKASLHFMSSESIKSNISTGTPNTKVDKYQNHKN